MNHAFIASSDGTDKCARCKYPLVIHTDKATCECCPNIGPVEIRYGNMLMCADCWEREQNSTAEHMSEENQQKRVDEHNAQQKLLIEARRIDDSIQVRTDLFNAATVAIIDIKKAVDGDETITNKPYKLAEFLLDRFNHFKSVTFELQERLVTAGNEMKAIQVYLNNLANQLRTEEREKLKIADINYKPGMVKVTKPKAITTTSTRKSSKIDKIALKKFAMEIGISEFMLQQIVVAKGVTVEQAADIIKKSIAAAKSS